MASRWISLTSGNGVTLWVGPNTPISTAGRDLIAHILAHEIGHNLGLLHITASQNLLLASYSPGELLNPSQTITARSSSFAVAVAEAGTKPTVAVTSPQDQFVTLQSGVSVLGTALDARGISGVTVAGTPATSSDGFATWSAMLTGLTPGQNTLTVVATDKVTPGNTTSIPWHVFYATDTGDADGDGLPDDWEFTNGLDLFDNGSVSPSNGALGDPDHDGIANLPEYALNGNPHEPGSAILPVSAIEINPSDGNPYLTFTYHRRINPTGISYGVEVSGDVAAWISDPVNYEEIAPPVPDPNGITETVRLRIKPTVNQSGNPARFVRFRTTKSP